MEYHESIMIYEYTRGGVKFTTPSQLMAHKRADEDTEITVRHMGTQSSMI